MKMNKKFFSPLLIIGAILLLANSSQHPTSGSGGFTGAPGDGTCAGSCHGGTGGGIDGTINISGFPAMIVANTTYTLSIDVTATAGTPAEVGFQMVALNSLNLNSGTFSNPSTGSSIKMVAGRSYHGHNPAASISIGSTVTWTVDWTAPSNPNGETITFYAGSILANGNNNNGGDKFIATNASGTLTGATVPVTLSITGQTDVICQGEMNGTATVSVTGGTSPYTLLWDNGETSNTAMFLDAGLHTVVATDAVMNTGSTTVMINEPSAVVGSIVNQFDATCFGFADGSANLVATGGTPPYSFTWPDAIVSPARSDLEANSYTVVVSDINDCSSSFEITIGQPAQLTTSSTKLTEPTCGNSDGLISVGSVGGTPGYTYSWSTGESGNSISGLTADTYTVSTTDANLCTSIDSFTLFDSSTINISVINQTDATCSEFADGTAEVEATGGMGPYTFSWSDTGMGNLRTDLLAGNYVVTVEDSNNCLDSLTIIIGQLPTLIGSIDQITEPTCFGDSNGGAIVSATGGTPPYSFIWPDGTVNDTINNLTAGVYIVEIVDSLMCSSSINIQITEPQQIVITLDSLNSPLCNGDQNGMVALSANGGLGNLSYQWPDMSNDSIRTDLGAGIYWITVTDSLACLDSLQVILSQPTQLVANATTTAETTSGENDGTATASPTGGTMPYEYDWSTGDSIAMIMDLAPGNYVVTVTDSNGCAIEEIVAVAPGDCSMMINVNTTPVSCFGTTNGTAIVNVVDGTAPYEYAWSTDDSTSIVTGLATGVYSVTVTDSLLCQSIISNVFVDTPEEISVTPVIIEAPVCANESTGVISVSLNGGTGPFSYDWELGSTSDTLIGVLPGSYPVTVTDINLCTGSGIVNLGNADFESPISLLNDITLNIDNAGNIDTFGDADIDGGSTDNCGIAGFIYDQNPFDCMDIGVQTLLIDIVDDNGNVKKDSITVTIIDAVPPNVLCPTDIVTNNCNPLTFPEPTAFDNCGIAEIRQLAGPASGESFNFGKTDVIFEIEDFGGNVVECSFEVFVDINFEYDYQSNNVVCYGENNGTVEFSFSGTNLPFEVEFDDNDIDPNALFAGEYPYQVVDATGCYILDTLVIEEPDSFYISNVVITDATNSNSFDGMIDITVVGGTPNYSFQWFKDGGIVGVDEDLANLEEGTYSVVIIDANDCTYVSDEFVVQNTVSSYDLDLKNEIDYYPNPANNVINIKLLNDTKRLRNIQIYNLQGALVLNQDVSSNEIRQSVKNLDNGLYFIRLQIDETLLSLKLIINHEP